MPRLVKSTNKRKESNNSPEKTKYIVKFLIIFRKKVKLIILKNIEMKK